MINRNTVISKTLLGNTILNENNENYVEIEYIITFIMEELNYNDINLAFNSIKQQLQLSIYSLKFNQLLHQNGISEVVNTGNIKFISETFIILRSMYISTNFYSNNNYNK